VVSSKEVSLSYKYLLLVERVVTQLLDCSGMKVRVLRTRENVVRRVTREAQLGFTADRQTILTHCNARGSQPGDGGTRAWGWRNESLGCEGYRTDLGLYG
jgi:hypothetical protein